MSSLQSHPGKDKQAKVFQQTCAVPGFIAKCKPESDGVFIKGMLLLSEVYFAWINLIERNSQRLSVPSGHEH